jgi:hypothetical protein
MQRKVAIHDEATRASRAENPEVGQGRQIRLMVDIRLLLGWEVTVFLVSRSERGLS